MWPDKIIREWGRDNIIQEWKRYVARQLYVGVGGRCGQTMLYGGEIILYRSIRDMWPDNIMWVWEKEVARQYYIGM